MTPWRVANSINTLRSQLNTLYPNRSKVSDGTIGDTAHAATVSDHNPDRYGIVRAFDITHDPAHGLDGTKLAAALAASRDPRISYVIWNRRMLRSYPKPGIPAWTWAPYTGSDPHTNHVHLSVVATGLADSTTAWKLTAGKDWSDMATRDEIKQAIREVLAEPETARQLFTGHAICKDTRKGAPAGRRVAPSALLEEAAKP